MPGPKFGHHTGEGIAVEAHRLKIGLEALDHLFGRHLQGEVAGEQVRFGQRLVRPDKVVDHHERPLQLSLPPGCPVAFGAGPVFTP